jgi:hypothetical protein
MGKNERHQFFELALQAENEVAALAAMAPAEPGAEGTTPGETTASRSTPPDE